ncbi:RNA polymerase sigma factor [Leptospira noguchii]|uniref:Sigma-70, region 4 n=2 Tax=Leptospira noguchii TaxID=28182 RepID=M6YD02_9LEPT|nr:RNA polymerase sigma factor [Leptospira noguchii]EMM98553.1 sigma-70, region 4 [Leptospira noguchii str. 2007001578]EMO89751.1 sigma-70, region 4 [Leptospira noguchii str. 2001034031]
MIKDFRTIINGCLMGNSKGWKEFLLAYDRLLNGIVIQTFGRRDSEDIVQRIIEELIKDDFRLLRQFTGESEIAFKVYLKNIGRNVARNEFRKLLKRREATDWQDNEVEIVMGKQAEEAWQKGESEAHYRELSNEFESLIEKLDFTSRQVILYRRKGYKHREIAVMMAMPLGTITSLCNRAIVELKKFRSS